MGRLWWVFLLSLLVGCGGLSASRTILPEVETETTVLPQSRGLAANKDNISVVVAPLQDVKGFDGFVFIIVNETSNWVYFKKEDIILIQGGKARYPASDTEIAKRLGSTYKPTLPSGINSDIFEWRQSINARTSHGLRIVDKDKRLSIIGNAKEKLFVFFKTEDNTEPIQLIVNNIENDTTKQRTRFSFKFSVRKD